MIDYGKFTVDELSCKCCNTLVVQPVFIQMLNRARDIANIPFRISSGYRCEKHNEKEGGKKNSAHTKGWAVDIKTRGSRERYIILTSLIEAGFNRMGIADTFIHVDYDPDLPKEVIWTY